MGIQRASPFSTSMVVPAFSLHNTTQNNDVRLLISPEEHYLIGAALAVIGNFVIAVSLNVQKFVHRKQVHEKDSENLSEDSKTSICPPGSYLCSGTWWLGISLMVLGEAGNFVAYGFAPASVVAPLGCVAVIANGALAVTFNNEILRMQDVMGVTFSILGSFLIIQFSKQSDNILNSQQIVEHLGAWQFVIYIFVEIMAFGVIIFVRSYEQYGDDTVILHLVLIAILGSFTVISAKALSGLVALSVEGSSQFLSPVLYVMFFIMVVTTIMQVKYLNEAMAKFDIATVVPINYVFFTLSAIVAGAIFYQEFLDQPLFTIIMFVFGCAMSFLGVIFITSDKGRSGRESIAFHLDAMPHFIQTLAPSMRISSVQPAAVPNQRLPYPDVQRTPPVPNTEGFSNANRHWYDVVRDDVGNPKSTLKRSNSS